MTACYVSVGSNIDKAKNIEAGLASLRETFGELTISPIYETVAVGFEGDDFFNLVVSFETHLSAHDVFEVLRQLEFKQGRLRNSQKFTPRKLDLDLLLFGDMIIHDDVLKIPRDDIEKYRFVLQPLADIAPDLIHPILHKSYREMLSSIKF
jgi:2-amino-4-hydroxy-6-hydroxymethyldihydropteridine diphosphokinase